MTTNSAASEQFDGTDNNIRCCRQCEDLFNSNSQWKAFCSLKNGQQDNVEKQIMTFIKNSIIKKEKKFHVD